MNDRELQDWLDKHGGERGRDQKKKRVPNPDYNDIKGESTTNPKTIEVPDTTILIAHDGAKLTLRRVTPEGSESSLSPGEQGPVAPTYEVVTRDEGATRSSSAMTPAQQLAYDKAAREEAERAKNRGLPPGQDPMDETDAERAKRADERIKEQGAAETRDKAAAALAAERERDNTRADAAATRAEHRETAADTRAIEEAKARAVAANKPVVVQIPNGPTLMVTPDGTKTEIAPGQTEVKTEKDGRTYETVRGPDGRVVDIKDVTPKKPGTATYSPRELKLQYGQITQELMGSYKEVSDKVMKGEMTPQEGQAALEPIFKLGESRITELNGIVTAQKALLADQYSYANNQQTTANARLSTSGALMQLSTGILSKAGEMAPGTGAAAAQAAYDTLQQGRGFAGSMGGLRDVPEPTPAAGSYLDQVRRMGPGLPAAPPASPPTWSGPPLASPPSAPLPLAPPPPTTTIAPDGSVTIQHAPAATAAPAPPNFMQGSSSTSGNPYNVPGYLQGAAAPPKGPDHSIAAADLLEAGFDPSVVDAVHQEFAGQPLFGQQEGM